MNASAASNERGVVAAWVDLIDTSEAMLRAGLETDSGPHGTAAAYDAWPERLDRDRRLEHFLSALSRAERSGGR